MADTVSCTACGSANEAGRKFCGECGASLALACPSCGTLNAGGVKFCGECGTPLTVDGAAPAGVSAESSPRAAERRLVSVLFAGPRRFHDRLRGPRRRRDTRAPLPLLRHLARDHRALRRHGREVHRRRGHGGLGNSDGDRGRRGTRRASGPRPRRGRARARSGAERARRRFSPARRRSPSGPRARGWSPATSSTRRRASSPRRSQARCSSGRRRSAPPRPRSPMRTAGEHELKGKAEPVPALARAPRHRRPRRRAQVRRRRAALRRA